MTGPAPPNGTLDCIPPQAHQQGPGLSDHLVQGLVYTPPLPFGARTLTTDPSEVVPMTSGHRDAIDLWLRLGERLGYRAESIFSQKWPSDGVWILPSVPCLGLPRLPVAAAEVVVSEGAKNLAGSVSTLEVISPSLAVIVLNEEEIFRGAVRSGKGEADISVRLTAVHSRLNDLISRSKQRFEIWSIEQLRRRVSLMSGGG
jgi:hypothetical protein